MDKLLSESLQKVIPSQNVDKFWNITLYSDMRVFVSWGRRGNKPQGKEFFNEDVDDRCKMFM